MRVTTRRHLQGFTIIEMLIVVVIIAILATITVVGYNSVTQRAASSTLESDLTRAATKLNSLKADAGTYVSDITEASLQASTGTDYQYTYNSVANNYCLTAKNTSGVAYHIANDGKPTEGPCNGHTGNPPTDLDCPSGYITVPGNSLFGTQKFCVMKYEAKDVGGVATSQASGAPWVSISQTSAVTTSAAACDGCHLITESEWLTIAHNALGVAGNWSGGAVGLGYVYAGHNDVSPAGALAGATGALNDCYGTITAGADTSCATSGAQHRSLALSNGQVIWDLAGNVNEWTSGSYGTGQQPGLSGEVSLAWKEWNNSALIKGGLSSSTYPKYGTAAASVWDGASQSIGCLYSNYSDSQAKSFARGGAYNSTTNAGPFTVNAGNDAATSASTIGFRVTR